MAYLNTKIKISSKIFVILAIYCISAISVNASSFSSNYWLNDEALDFANSSEYLYGTNASMDLSSIFWTSRIMESASYSVIDANSDLSSGVIPPGPGGGGGGPIAGGRPVREGEKDKAEIETLPIDQKPDLDLHEAPDVIPEEEKPVLPLAPKKTYTDDQYGCSPRFENKFMNTNPYDYDSDNDGTGDCDEQLVYGLNPLEKDATDDHTGLALFKDYIYTEERPFLVGRADFGTNTFETTKNLQIELNYFNTNDIFETFGLFSLYVKKDLNFAEYAKTDLKNGEYQAKLYLDGQMQYKADYFKVDNTLLYTELKLDVPENNILTFENRYIKLTGTSGINYGVVAIWQSEDFVDVSAVVADKEGKFTIYSPRSFENGEYTVTLYGLIQKDDKIIQTNYQEIKYKVESDKAVIIRQVYADVVPVDYAAADLLNNFYPSAEETMTNSSNNTTLPLTGFLAFISFTLIGFYFLWKQKNT